MNEFKRMSILPILLLSIFYSNDAFAYDVQDQSSETPNNDSENKMTIHPLYCNPSIITCWGENRLYFDAPWRVNPNKKIIPVYAIINKPVNIERIILYDTLNQSIIVDQVFNEPLTINDSQIPYTFNFSVDRNALTSINNRAQLEIVLTTSALWESNNTEGPINITLSTDSLPLLKNWYYGDTHYHSSYTFNDVELGGPLPATMNAINAMGLDWITVTDHSFTLKTDEKWNAFKDECTGYSNCLISEEISCDNPGIGNYNHYLGYNLTNRIYSGEYPDNGTSPQPCSDIVNQVNAQGGFGYTAHPFYREGWGITYRNVWQDYNLPFTGMEIWNHEENIAELEQGLAKWRELLLNGRHIFIEAGSDAHGDFNSALGKVRTACFAQNFTKDNIFTALKNGNCMMTDGPIIVFNVNNHIIGESFNVSEGDAVQLNISWNSTNEFGNVTEIFLIRGEINGDERNETILSPNNLTGNFAITSTPNNTYYRIEARSIDSEGTIRRAYTNPIWAYAEPHPGVEKIPMDETELELIAAFENKYDYSLKNLFFDGEPTTTCDINGLRENLGLNSSWKSVKCEKMILNNTRLMWAGLNNTETNETKIVLQIGNFLQYANATYNQFTQRWATCCSPGYGIYSNNNWAATKNGKEIFDLNEIYNTNWAGDSHFGTYLVHGFQQYEGNTTVYYTHWGPDSIKTYRGAAKIYLNFDNAASYPIAYEGFYYDYVSRGSFNRGIFQKRAYAYNASSFRFAADGQFKDGWGFQGDGTGYDSISRSIFRISQTNETINCHADIDCNDGNLFTKDICTNAGTTDSKCEHIPQEPEDIKKPFTEMDADEVSKAIDFKTKYNKTLGELYFDGWKNTTCNNAGILETLKLDNNWSSIQCNKFLINGTLAMFAGINNTKTGEKYAAYQIGNVLIDENAEYKQISEGQKILYWTYDPVTYYQDFWSGWKNGKKRFEINSFSLKTCDLHYCFGPTPYGTYIIHGFGKNANKKEYVLYSHTKQINSDIMNIWFDKYVYFSIDNYSSSGNLYEIKTFNYTPVHDWALGTSWFNYALHNRSTFPPYRANELVVGLESPAHLRAQDSLGRITGYFNGTYITEIPNSAILDTEHEKYLLPANESYRFFVEGYTNGNYNLKITRASGENSSIIYFKNISATNETSDVFTLNETGSVGIKTNDSEKNIIVALDGMVGPSESMEFTAAKNKSISISISNWGALNESTTITENINYAPEIISTLPNNGTSFGQWQNITLGAYATDPNNDSLEYIISFDGAELSRANETTHVLNETGTHTINFIASDSLNTVSEEIQIYVIAPPKVTIISPENRTYNGSIIFVSAIFEEPVDTAWLSVDGAPGQNYTKNTYSISLDMDALPDGAHNVGAYANNSLGTENYSIVFFAINTTVAVPTTPPSNGGGWHDNDKKENKTKEKDKDEKRDEKEDRKENKNTDEEKDKHSKDKEGNKNITHDNPENETRFDNDFLDSSEPEDNDSYYTGRLLGNISEKLQKLIMMLLKYIGFAPHS